MLAALKANFPAIYQSVTNLPYVTNGWYNVPGTAHLTAFSGAAVRSMPQVRTYLATDVVPFLGRRCFSSAGGGRLSRPTARHSPAHSDVTGWE